MSGLLGLCNFNIQAKAGIGAKYRFRTSREQQTDNLRSNTYQNTKYIDSAIDKVCCK